MLRYQNLFSDFDDADLLIGGGEAGGGDGFGVEAADHRGAGGDDDAGGGIGRHTRSDIAGLAAVEGDGVAADAEIAARARHIDDGSGGGIILAEGLRAEMDDVAGAGERRTEDMGRRVARRGDGEFQRIGGGNGDRAPESVGGDGGLAQRRALALPGDDAPDSDGGAGDGDVARGIGLKPREFAVEHDLRRHRRDEGLRCLAGDGFEQRREGRGAEAGFAVVQVVDGDVLRALQRRPGKADLGWGASQAEIGAIGLGVFVIGGAADGDEADAGHDLPRGGIEVAHERAGAVELTAEQEFVGDDDAVIDRAAKHGERGEGGATAIFQVVAHGVAAARLGDEDDFVGAGEGADAGDLGRELVADVGGTGAAGLRGGIDVAGLGVAQVERKEAVARVAVGFKAPEGGEPEAGGVAIAVDEDDWRTGGLRGGGGAEQQSEQHSMDQAAHHRFPKFIGYSKARELSACQTQLVGATVRDLSGKSKPMPADDHHDHHHHGHDHDHDHHGHAHHGHDHSGHHGHSHAPKSFGVAFAVGTALNLGLVMAQVVYGLTANSMALLADAAHNFGDVLALLLAWGAAWMGQRLPSARRTYGWGRGTILAALINAVVLLIGVGAIGVDAVHRLQSPEPVSGGIVIAVGLAGIAVNGVTAWLFSRGHDDLNIRAAFLHMAGDAAVSLGVVLAAAAIMATGWVWLDPVTSLAIVVVIVVGTWGMLRDAVNLTMDGVPGRISQAEVARFLGGIVGVEEVHDLHIWALSTTQIALTAHLVRADAADDQTLIQAAVLGLQERFAIDHATVQVETRASASACRLRPMEVI